MRRFTFASLTAFAAFGLAVPAGAQDAGQQDASQPSAAGEYTVPGSFEMYVGLLLSEDGTYEFALSVGALDKTSKGTWEQDGQIVTLTTTPKPVPPAFALAGPDQTIAEDPDAPSLVRVTWPNGRDIPGVDIRLGCSEGTIATGYTQYDGWSPGTPDPVADPAAVPDPAPKAPCTDPQWISLTERIHDIGPAWFALTDSPERIHVVLVPNDFGVMDMTGATSVLDGETLSLQLMGSAENFVRVRRAPD